jgi:hypothetical protein
MEQSAEDHIDIDLDTIVTDAAHYTFDGEWANTWNEY